MGRSFISLLLRVVHVQVVVVEDFMQVQGLERAVVVVVNKGRHGAMSTKGPQGGSRVPVGFSTRVHAISRCTTQFIFVGQPDPDDDDDDDGSGRALPGRRPADGPGAGQPDV